MKKNFTFYLSCSFTAAVLLAISICVFQSCHHVPEKKIYSDVAESGMLLGDDLEAVKESNGKISIVNVETGETTIKNIKIDWTSSTNDSLAVFCSGGRRGYYNIYTGKIVVEAKYRRAWLFSEGLAAVQKNGNIGFINSNGDVVIPFNYPYHGNCLTEFIFKDGRCVVANKEGKCGVIDTLGNWLIKPEYNKVVLKKDYALLKDAGVCRQVSFDGKVLNSCIYDYVRPLTYDVERIYENKDGELSRIRETLKTGCYVYSIGDRCGIMDSNCKRLTEPLYRWVEAIDANLFTCSLSWSDEVLVNSKGQVIK